MTPHSATAVRRIAVIGAGTIGASWTAWFLSRGLEVVASDPAPGAPDLIRRTVADAWPILQGLGATADADPERWRFEADPVRAVSGCDFVQESAPERLEVKGPLLRAITAALPPEVVVASSTSGLLVSRLSEGCAHPERVVIGHPFNPPH
jgi:carnitine 3-dehydrogenase